VANFDGSQYNISFLQYRSKQFCFLFRQRRGSNEIFISCWLNRFDSEVLLSGIYWWSEEYRMASGEEPSSHSVCSKNASPFSGGSGTSKLSSLGTDLISEFRFCVGLHNVMLIICWEICNTGTREAGDILRKSRCVIELKDKNKLICYTETQ